MGKEVSVQQKAIKYLKSKGCWVMKTHPGLGTPTGTSDIFFCKEGFYGWLECKASAKAPFRPLQREFIEKMDAWSFARAVYPENLDEVIAELDRIL